MQRIQLNMVYLSIALALTAGTISCQDSNEAKAPKVSGEEKAPQKSKAKGASAKPKRVVLSDEALQRNDIQVEQARAGQLESAIEATAKVTYAVGEVAHIAPIVEGQIAQVEATLGDQVKAGQVVARIRSVELGKARAKVAETEAVLDVAKLNFERAKKLHDAGISSERAFIEARGELRKARAKHDAAKSQLETYGVRGGSGPMYPLRSHIDGEVVEQEATRGEIKGPNDKLFVVADPSKVWMIAEVYETDIAEIHHGKAATVSLDAYPGRVWRAHVDWIARSVDPTTRTLPVRVVLDNDKGKLRPGMYGKMRFTRGEKGAQAVVPVDAVQKVKGKHVVFVPGDEKGVFEVRPVELGEEADGMAVVEEGLAPGDRLVTVGSFRLRVALKASGSSAGGAH